jgi:hypothetical protein
VLPEPLVVPFQALYFVHHLLHKPEHHVDRRVRHFRIAVRIASGLEFAKRMMPLVTGFVFELASTILASKHILIISLTAADAVNFSSVGAKK